MLSTFLGRDAVEALKAYLKNVKSRGLELNGDTLLLLLPPSED